MPGCCRQQDNVRKRCDCMCSLDMEHHIDGLVENYRVSIPSALWPILLRALTQPRKQRPLDRCWLDIYRVLIVSWLGLTVGHVCLVPIIGTTEGVSYLYVKSVQHIWRSNTRRFHLRVFDLQVSCRPWQQGSWDQHGAHLGPTGPRWAPCWPHELCYLGRPGPRLNMKTVYPMYGDSHVKDKTVARPSYL